MKVGDLFFFLSAQQILGCCLYQALIVYSAVWRVGFHGTFKNLGDIASIWELLCLFLSAQMESTIGVEPICLLNIGFQEHQDTNLNRPDFLSRVPIGAWRSLFILKSLHGFDIWRSMVRLFHFIANHISGCMKPLTLILQFDELDFMGRVSALGAFYRFRSCLVCFWVLKWSRLMVWGQVVFSKFAFKSTKMQS